MPALDNGDYLTAAFERAQRAVIYFRVRATHPDLPARVAFGWANGEGAGHANLREYACDTTRGHEWAYTGTAYGGDDDSYHGEGRAYCIHCGADGDA